MSTQQPEPLHSSSSSHGRQLPAGRQDGGRRHTISPDVHGTGQALVSSSRKQPGNQGSWSSGQTSTRARSVAVGQQSIQNHWQVARRLDSHMRTERPLMSHQNGRWLQQTLQTRQPPDMQQDDSDLNGPEAAQSREAQQGMRT